MNSELSSRSVSASLLGTFKEETKMKAGLHEAARLPPPLPRNLVNQPHPIGNLRVLSLSKDKIGKTATMIMLKNNTSLDHTGTDKPTNTALLQRLATPMISRAPWGKCPLSSPRHDSTTQCNCQVSLPG